MVVKVLLVQAEAVPAVHLEVPHEADHLADLEVDVQVQAAAVAAAEVPAQIVQAHNYHILLQKQLQVTQF